MNNIKCNIGEELQIKNFIKRINLFLIIITIALANIVFLLSLENKFVVEQQMAGVIDSKTIQAIVYAYSSEKRQTDDSPYITASNQKVRKGIVANNCLPFGTKVKIVGEIFEVQDKMNKRYGCDVFDIWHESTHKAREWGKQLLEVRIYEL